MTREELEHELQNIQTELEEVEDTLHRTQVQVCGVPYWDKRAFTLARGFCNNIAPALIATRRGWRRASRRFAHSWMHWGKDKRNK